MLDCCKRGVPFGPYMGSACLWCLARSASKLSATPHQPRVGRMRDCAGLTAACAGCAAIVGRLGLVPLGAVGLSNLVHFFATVFFSFLLVVTTPRVADALAVRDARQARQGFRAGPWHAVACRNGLKCNLAHSSPCYCRGGHLHGAAGALAFPVASAKLQCRPCPDKRAKKGTRAQCQLCTTKWPMHAFASWAGLHRHCAQPDDCGICGRGAGMRAVERSALAHPACVPVCTNVAQDS